MTNWEYIKTLDEAEIARLISLSVISDDDFSSMFICGAGHFQYQEDFEDWLKSERTK